MLSDPTSAGAHAAELDAQALDRLRELDRSGAIHLVVKVVRAFEASIARHLPKLRIALDEGDRRNLHYHAHTLKTSAAYLGATVMSQRCATIEKQAPTAANDALAALVFELEALADPTLLALRALPELAAP